MLGKFRRDYYERETRFESNLRRAQIAVGVLTLLATCTWAVIWGATRTEQPVSELETNQLHVREPGPPPPYRPLPLPSPSPSNPPSVITVRHVVAHVLATATARQHSAAYDADTLRSGVARALHLPEERVVVLTTGLLTASLRVRETKEMSATLLLDMVTASSFFQLVHTFSKQMFRLDPLYPEPYIEVMHAEAPWPQPPRPPSPRPPPGPPPSSPPMLCVPLVYTGDRPDGWSSCREADDSNILSIGDTWRQCEEQCIDSEVCHYFVYVSFLSVCWNLPVCEIVQMRSADAGAGMAGHCVEQR